MTLPLGSQLKNSPKVQALMDEIALEVENSSQSLTGLKGPQNAEALERAVTNIGKVRGRPLVYSYLGSGLGKGAYVELEDGSVKIDLINGIGVHLMGHSHPVVVKASLRGALSDIVQHGHLQMNQEYLDVSQKLVEMAGRKSRLKHVWLTTSGSMANENALKIVRQKKTPARKILALERAFAGRSTMMAEITDNPAYRQGLPAYDEVLRVPFYSKAGSPKGNVEQALARVKEHVDKHRGDISAFMFEPVLGEGGYRVMPQEYLKPILTYLKLEGIAIWADEVQTFLRTGEAFAFETLGFGEFVDVVTVAKTLQLGATLYTEEYNPQPGLIAGTFAASSQALHVAQAILKEMDEGGYFGKEGRVAQINRAFAGGLEELSQGSCKGLISDIESLGLMVAFTPYQGGREEVSDFLKRLYSNGVITLSCGRDPFRARFLVPASITEVQIREALQVIEKTLTEK